MVVVVVAFPLANEPRLSKPREGAGGRSSSCASAEHTTQATRINLKRIWYFLKIKFTFNDMTPFIPGMRTYTYEARSDN